MKRCYGNRFKRVLAVFLSASLALGILAGCGKNEDGSGDGAGDGRNGRDSRTLAANNDAAKQGVFRASPIDIGNADDANIAAAALVGDRIFFAVTEYSWGESGSEEVKLSVYSVDRSGGDLQRTELAGASDPRQTAIRRDSGGKPVYTIDDDFAVEEDAEEETAEVPDTEGETSEVPDAEEETSEEPETEEDAADPEEPGDFPDEGGEMVSSWEYLSYDNLQFLPDGTLIAVRNYTYDDYSDPEEYVSLFSKALILWTAEGEVAGEINLCEEFGADSWIQDVYALADDGTFLINYRDSENWEPALAHCSVSGERLEDLEVTEEISAWSENMSGLCRAADGTPLVLYYSYEEKFAMYAAKLDPATLRITESVELPYGIVMTGISCFGAGVASDLIFGTDTGLQAYNFGSETATPYMDCLNSDLNTYGFNFVLMIDEEHFLGSYNDSTDYSTKCALFSYVDPASIADRTALTLASYYLSGDLRRRIVDFNETNGEYRITVKTYEGYATEDDYYAGFHQLNADILSGQMPDILVLSDQGTIDVAAYARKGLLADVERLIEQDEELSGLTYLSNVFDAFRIGGKLYQVIPSFGYQTFIGKEKIFDGMQGWTAAEFLAFAQTLDSSQQMMENLTQDQFLRYMMQFCGSEFVDKEEGRCSFDSETFIDLLRYCATLPQEIDWDQLYENPSYWEEYQYRYSSERTMLMLTYLSQMQDFQYSAYSYFMEPYVEVGFPSGGGKGSVIQVNNSILIADNANTAGAWQFLRQYLAPEYQASMEWSIPVLESAFEAWAARGMEYPYWEDENGNREYYNNTYYIDGQEYEVPLMTQAQIDALKASIRATDTVMYQNEEILAIVEEEASACFSGQKSAEEVARIIQSRVQIYVQENS